jgi:hypothetical protein
VEAGKNAIWCASLPALWKSIEEHDSGGPIVLQGRPATAESLNKTKDPRADIPSGALYLASGLVKDGIADRIGRELPQRFPGKTPPNFPDAAPDDLFAYAHLNVGVEFTTPYWSDTLQWTDRDDKTETTKVVAFSASNKGATIPAQGESSSMCFGEPDILYWKSAADGSITDCIIDLDPNPGHDQLLIAYMDYKSSLGQMFAETEDKISRAPAKKEDRKLRQKDTLLVPCLKWDISHRLREIEKRPILEGRMKGHFFACASQTISFNFDRNGALLESEVDLLLSSGIEDNPPPERHFNFTRPFLIVMKKRDAAAPYFVMWVENAELMSWCKRDWNVVSPQ